MWGTRVRLEEGLSRAAVDFLQLLDEAVYVGAGRECAVGVEKSCACLNGQVVNSAGESPLTCSASVAVQCLEQFSDTAGPVLRELWVLEEEGLSGVSRPYLCCFCAVRDPWL